MIHWLQCICCADAGNFAGRIAGLGEIAIYCRVSTDDQSCERQKGTCGASPSVPVTRSRPCSADRVMLSEGLLPRSPRTAQDYIGHRDPKHTAHYTRVAGPRSMGFGDSNGRRYGGLPRCNFFGTSFGTGATAFGFEGLQQ